MDSGERKRLDPGRTFWGKKSKKNLNLTLSNSASNTTFPFNQRPALSSPHFPYAQDSPSQAKEKQPSRPPVSKTEAPLSQNQRRRPIFPLCTQSSLPRGSLQKTSQGYNTRTQHFLLLWQSSPLSPFSLTEHFPVAPLFSIFQAAAPLLSKKQRTQAVFPLPPAAGPFPLKTKPPPKVFPFPLAKAAATPTPTGSQTFLPETKRKNRSSPSQIQLLSHTQKRNRQVSPPFGPWRRPNSLQRQQQPSSTRRPTTSLSHRRPLETERRGKRKEKRSEERSISENSERKAETDLLVAFLGVLQVTALLIADMRVKREGSHYKSPHALWISRRRVNPRAASCGGVWRRRAVTAPQFLRAPSAVPGLFRDLFVIFTCLNMYLNFC